MKKILLLTAIILFSGSSFLFAQISQGGIPPSFKYGIKSDVDKVVLHPRDMKYVLNEEEKLAKDGTLPHIGYSLSTDISMENSGVWSDLPDGGRIWQIQIKAPSALAQVVYYDNFHLPVGTKLFLYNEDKTQVIGAFTWYNNDPSGYFANELIYGDIVNLEYYEPAIIIGKPVIHINEIGYIYRGVSIKKNTNWTEPSEACEVNINCSPVGDNWQDEKKGVARILVTTPSGQGWCTGSLVNNTNQNCTPYFLTAWHCYEDATTTQLNQWIFYFNYEASGCTTPTTQPTSNSMTGASLKAAADITGGSDFILLQLNQTVPTSYNPYMNGWNRANAVTGPGVGIHHPASSIKKISTFNSATTSTYSGSALNAHWRIVWVSNSNGWGVTEGGSSGSPIFDANSRIVGTLTGGSSYCSAQSSPDYYGKFYYHWDLNAGGTTTQLKTWLDPTTSGVTVLDGKNCGSTSDTVHVDFSGTPLSVPVGGTVNFTDLSTGNPTSWEWTFEQGTPASSNVQNPTGITYNIVGTYYVKLKASNATTSDSLTKSLYVDVYDPNAISVDFSGDPLSIPSGGTVNFTDLSTGNPTSWEWTFEQGTPASSTVQNPTGITYNIVGTYYVKLKASNATTSDSLTKNLYIEVYDPASVHCDFIGNPTCIVAGNTVDFSDLSTNTPTTWVWEFSGGTPATSTVKNPQNILYSTPGVYNVKLTASNLTTSDTLTKLGYITVIATGDVPNANFIADYYIRPVGSTINFTNLSTGVYDSLHWYFSGAVPDNSTANNPVGILYSTVGDFDVTLILFSSSCSNDTLTKPLYIHIFDPANVDSVKADFHAITSRLIIKGSTVKFEDLSQGDITQWQWSFEYGSPATSTVQNPPTITYPTPAVCDVCLIVSNGIFSDTLCKTEYIVVTSTEWPGGSFCDTISNILPSEHPLSFMHLTPTYWGYFPGHNQLIPKYYADKFVNYTFSEVSTLLVPVVKAYSAAPSNKVLFTIWDTNNQGLPGNVLGTKVEYINNFVPNYYGVVNFDSPVPVNGEFFVGFQLYYNTPVDTFVVYMAPDRGITGTNTLYIRKDPTSAWLTPSQFLSPMSVHTSFAIQVVGCLTVIGVEEIDMDSQVVVYPNPSSDKINIELFDVITNIFDCKIYDITGRSLYAEPLEINTNHYEIDLSRFNNGIYLLEITVNNQKIIKKISVIK